MISIEDSSEPFRAFFGALLSCIESISVDASTFDPHMELDTITEQEEEDQGPPSEGDVSDGSGAFRGRISKGTVTMPPLTRKRARDGDNDSGLMVRLFLHCHLSCCLTHPPGYFVFHEIACILPGVDTSQYLSEQHPRPSAV
jgi:hypothetical protein